MIFWITTGIIFILDRFSKMLVTSKMAEGQTIPIIDKFFHITYVNNPGAAFGILADKKWFFILATLIVLAVIIYLASSEDFKGRMLSITLGMITGGAMGNLLDRVRTGLVIDFLDFRGIWPYIFNLADSAIVVGVIFLSWQILRTEKV